MPIQIVENEHKEIEVAFEDGKKRRYYPGWQVILDVHSIQEAMQIQDETDEGVQAKRYITGTAVLQDRDISIIGEPDKKTRTLELGIWDREVPLRDDGEQPGFSARLASPTSGSTGPIGSTAPRTSGTSRCTCPRQRSSL